LGANLPALFSPLLYIHNWAKVGCPENISRQVQ
jgi:hypothetical protein